MPDPEDELSASPAVTYELRLSGGGVAVERKISEAQALQILSLVMGGAPSAGALSAAPVRRESQRGTLATTVGEYLEEVEAKRNPDKIVAIGAFLVEHLGQTSFTREDVKAQFQHAGETPPANFARDFSVAITSKWIAQSPGSAGEYFVTNTGRKAIADKFAGEARKSRRGSTRRKAPKKASASE